MSWIASSFDDYSSSWGSVGTEQQQNKTWTKVRSSKAAYQSIENNKLWVNKYAPRCAADLAVNTKKIANVRDVLERSFARSTQSGHGGQIILLNGEAGSGKSATLHILANELRAELKEWVSPAADQFVTKGFVNTEDSQPYESQWSKFCDFLFRANRYSSLVLSADNVQEQRRIIVIEDFPHIFTRNIDSFHSVLRRYRSHGRCPLVFILGSSDGGSFEHLLFPKTLLTELCIEMISFNAVAPTVLSKMLIKIASQESSSGCSSLRMPDADVIEQLVASSHGDIRAAINALQFYCQTAVNDVCQVNSRQTANTKRKCDRKSKVAKTSVEKTKKLKQTGDADSSICGRDTMLTLFHAVGKVLHCKREDTTSQSEDLLPEHMSSLRRRSLLVDPEDVAEKVHLTSEQFIAFLHQNFVDFHTDIDYVVSSLSYLSDCETLTANWAIKQLLQSYAVSVATRGCLFSMPNGPTNVGWKPLHKPQMADINRKVNHQAACSQDLFASQHLSSVILHTELFPYLAACARNVGLTPSQSAHVNSIARMPKNAVAGGARLERLNERDATVFDNDSGLSDLAGTSGIAAAEQHCLMTDTNRTELHSVDYTDSDVIIEDFDD